MSDSSSPLILGRYALYDKIASGGMATVHLGRLLGPVGFGRTVAIKRLHAHLAEDPDFVAMLLDEARIAARISHPNVVPTLDVVATNGELFVVMEYIRGMSLAHVVRLTEVQGIPVEVAATLLVGALHGLHAAHEAKSDSGEPLGIVHRDVSPQNILLAVDGMPRLADFGVAKALGRIQATRNGQLKGKLGYMAPEQITGTASQLTDVYAASVVLWELLAKRRMVEGANEGEVLSRALTGTSTPPSKYAAGIPAALDAVVLRGLDVDAAKRFRSAREMARAIEEVIPPLAPSRIGDWVESIVGDVLAERSARIAQIERDSSSLPPPSSDGSQSRRSTPGLASNNDLTRPSGSAGSTPAQSPSGASAQRRGVPRAVSVVGAGLVAASLIAAAVLRHGALVDAARADPITAPSSQSAAPAATAPLDTELPITPRDVPSARLASSLTDSPPARPSTLRSPRPQRPAGVSAAHCDPPWYEDSRGVHVFKRECL